MYTYINLSSPMVYLMYVVINKLLLGLCYLLSYHNFTSYNLQLFNICLCY